MWFVGWVLISCGFMLGGAKLKFEPGADSNIGGATPPQKGLTMLWTKWCKGVSCS